MGGVGGGVKLEKLTNLTISDQCSHFISSENNRKPLVFWCFQWVQNRNIDQNWVKINVRIMLEAVN